MNVKRITKQVTEYRKARNFVRVIVLIGITASIAANTLGAANWIDAAVAAWPPLSLLLSIEVLTRVPASKRFGSVVRILSTLAVGVAAGWLSYFHMAATVSQHGEHGINAYVWPFSVDGLMTISAVALVELGAKIRDLAAKLEEIADAAVTPVTVTPQPAAVNVVPVAPAPVVPQAPAPVTPSPVAQAQQVVRQTSATMPAPTSPAPAGAKDRVMRSPLTGRILMESTPRS